MDSETSVAPRFDNAAPRQPTGRVFGPRVANPSRPGLPGPPALLARGIVSLIGLWACSSLFAIVCAPHSTADGQWRAPLGRSSGANRAATAPAFFSWAFTRPADAQEPQATPSGATPIATTSAPANSSEVQPTDAKPTDAKPTDAKPTDAKPTDTKPADTKPADTKPADAKPADAKPADTKPADAKPADAKLVEPKGAVATPTLEPQASRPDVYYLRDKDGKLVPVPDFSYEDFKRLYDLDRQLADAVAPPRYVLNRMAAQGRVENEVARLKVEFRLTLKTDSWVAVPLRLNGAVLRTEPQYDGPGQVLLEHQANRDGYVVWLRDTAEKPRLLTLDLAVPLRKQGTGRRLAFTAPLAAVSELRMTVPGQKIMAQANDGATPPVVRAAGPNLSEILVAGMGGEFQLSWSDSPAAAAAAAVSLEATAAVSVRIEGPKRLTSEGRLRVRSYGAPLTGFRVKLPAGLEWFPLNEPGYRVALVETLPVAGGAPVSIVEVALDNKSGFVADVRLRAVTPAKEPPADARIQTLGFEVVNAVRQQGVVDFVVEGDWSVTWPDRQNVVQMEVPAALRQQRVAARFEFFRQPASLGVLVQPRQTRVYAEPTYTLRVDTDALRLSAALRYRVRGPSAPRVQLNLAGWRVENLRPEDLFDREQAREGADGLWTLPFAADAAAAATQDFELRFEASRPLASVAEPLTVALPRPKADAIAPTRLKVVTAENILLSPRWAEIAGGIPTTSPMTDADDIPGPNPADPAKPESAAAATSAGDDPQGATQPLLLEIRGDVEQPRFVADLQVRPQQLSVGLDNRLRVEPGRIVVEQRFRYRVAYEPLRELRLAAPRALAAGGFQVFQERAGGELAPLRVIADSETGNDAPNSSPAPPNAASPNAAPPTAATGVAGEKPTKPDLAVAAVAAKAPQANSTDAVPDRPMLEPTGGDPADSTPASDKPASDKPASDTPASDKPASDKPARGRQRRFAVDPPELGLLTFVARYTIPWTEPERAWRDVLADGPMPGDSGAAANSADMKGGHSSASSDSGASIQGRDGSPPVPLAVAVPLLMPVVNAATRLAGNTLAVARDAGWDVEVSDTRWLPDLRVSERRAGPGEVMRAAADWQDSVELEILAARAREDRGTVVRQVWVQSWFSRQWRQDRVSIRVEASDARVFVTLPADAERADLLVAVDGRRVIPVEAGGGRLRIDWPADRGATPVMPAVPALPSGAGLPPGTGLTGSAGLAPGAGPMNSVGLPGGSSLSGGSVGSERTVELSYLARRAAPGTVAAGKLAVPLPLIAGARGAQRWWWQLVLPPDEHLIGEPWGWVAQPTWQWRSGWVERGMAGSQRDLEQTLAATSQAAPPPQTNQYLFSTFAPSSDVEVWVADRPTLVLFASGLVLAAGLLALYVPLFRHPLWVWPIALVAFGVAMISPALALIIFQAGVAGIVLALLGMVLRLAVRRRAPPRPVLRPSTISVPDKPLSDLRRSRPDSAPAAPTATVPPSVLGLLFGCIAAGLSGTLSAEDDTLRFRRVLVREEQLPELARGYLPIPRREFDELWAAAAARLPSSAPATRLDRADYLLRWESPRQFAGQAQLAVRHAGENAAFLSLEPCDLSIIEPRWSSLPSATAAVRGALLNGSSAPNRSAGSIGLAGLAAPAAAAESLAVDDAPQTPARGMARVGLSPAGIGVVVESDGLLQWRFSLRAEETGTVSTSQRFRARVPLAPRQRLWLELPETLSPRCEDAIITGPRAETIIGDAPVATAALSGADRVWWCLEWSGESDIAWTVEPSADATQRPPPFAWRQHTEYEISAVGVELRANARLEVGPERLRELRMDVPAGLQIRSARLGDQTLAWTIGPATASDGRAEARIELPGLQGADRLLTVAAFAAVPLNSDWNLPAVRLLDGFWQESTVAVAITEPLQLLGCEVRGGRQTLARELAAPTPGYSLEAQFHDPAGGLVMRLGVPAAEARVLTGTSVAVEPAALTARGEALIQIVRGSAGRLSAEVPKAWIVDSVEFTPDTLVEDYSWEPAPRATHQRLQIRLRDPLTRERAFRLTVRAHRPRPATSDTLRDDSLRVLDIAGTADMRVTSRRLVAVREDPATPLSMRSDANVAWLSATNLSATETALIDANADYLFLDGPEAARLAGRAQRTSQAYGAELEVGVSVLRDRVVEQYRIGCEPRGAPVSRLVVLFSQNRAAPLSWRMADAAGSLIPARKLSAEELATLTRAAGEGWELLFRTARTKPFTVRAERTTVWDGTTLPLALISLPESETQRGAVRIEAKGGRAQVLAAGLERVPPPTRTSHDATEWLGGFRYDPARSPALALGPPARPPGQPPVWSWTADLVSRFLPAGGTVNTLDFELENRGARQVRLRLPDRAFDTAVYVDGVPQTTRTLPVRSAPTANPPSTSTPAAPSDATSDADRILVVALPAATPRPRLRIEYRLVGPPLGPWLRLRGPRSPHSTAETNSRGLPPSIAGLEVPELEAPVLAFRWRPTLPRNYRVLSAVASSPGPQRGWAGLDFVPSPPHSWLDVRDDQSAFQSGELSARQSVGPSVGQGLVRSLAEAGRCAAERCLTLLPLRSRMQTDASGEAWIACGVAVLPAISASADTSGLETAIAAPVEIRAVDGDWLTIGGWTLFFLQWGWAVWSSWRAPARAFRRGALLLGFVGAAAPWVPDLAVEMLSGLFCGELLGIGFGGLVAAWAPVAATAENARPAAVSLGSLTTSLATAPVAAPLVLLAFVGGWLLCDAGLCRPQAPSVGDRSGRAAHSTSTARPQTATAAVAGGNRAAGSNRAAGGSNGWFNIGWLGDGRQALADESARPALAEPSPVLFPVDDEGRPMGEYVHVPRPFYQELRRRARGLSTPLPGWLVRSAQYRGLVRDRGVSLERGSPVWEIPALTARWEIETLAAEQRVTLPLRLTGGPSLRQRIARDGVELANVGEWGEAGWTALLPAAGNYTVELSWRPTTRLRTAAETTANDESLPLGDRYGFSQSIPRIPDSRLAIEFPEGPRWLELPGVRGAIVRDDPGREWRAELGPVQQFTLEGLATAGDVNPAMPVNVDQLAWVRFRPGSVTLETVWTFSATEGPLPRLARLSLDPRLRWLPLSAGQPIARISNPDAGQPWIQWEWNESVGSQARVRLSFLLAGATGVGQWRMPRLEPWNARLDRRWLAVSTDSSLELQRTAASTLAPLPISEFQEAWGGGETPPAAAFRISMTEGVGGLSTRFRDPKWSARTTVRIGLDVGESHVFWTADIEPSQGAVWSHLIAVPPDLLIDEVIIAERGRATGRPVAWTKPSPDRLWCPLDMARESPHEIRLRGRFPTGPTRIWTPPVPTVVGADTVAERVMLYRPSHVSVDFQGKPQPIPTAAAVSSTAESPDGDDFLAGLGRRIGQWETAGRIAVDQLPRLKVRLETVLATARVGTSLAPTEAGVGVELRLRCAVRQGRLDELRVELPFSWPEKPVIEPAVPYSWASAPDGQRKRLLLRPKQPWTRDFELRVSGPVATVEESQVDVPEARLPDWDAVEYYLWLPRRNAVGELPWDTSGLQAVAAAESGKPPVPLPFPEWKEGEGTAFRVVAPRFRVLLPAADTGPRSPSVKWAEHQLYVDARFQGGGVSRFLLDGAGNDACIVDLPADTRLIDVRLDGRVATCEPQGPGRFRVALLGADWPQWLDIVYAYGTGEAATPLKAAMASSGQVAEASASSDGPPAGRAVPHASIAAWPVERSGFRLVMDGPFVDEAGRWRMSAGTPGGGAADVAAPPSSPGETARRGDRERLEAMCQAFERAAESSLVRSSRELADWWMAWEQRFQSAVNAARRGSESRSSAAVAREPQHVSFAGQVALADEIAAEAAWQTAISGFVTRFESVRTQLKMPVGEGPIGDDPGDGITPASVPAPWSGEFPTSWGGDGRPAPPSLPLGDGRDCGFEGADGVFAGGNVTRRGQARRVRWSRNGGLSTPTIEWRAALAATERPWNVEFARSIWSVAATILGLLASTPVWVGNRSGTRPLAKSASWRRAVSAGIIGAGLAWWLFGPWPGVGLVLIAGGIWRLGRGRWVARG